MKSMKKRLLSLTLCLAMVLSLLPVTPVEAETGTPVCEDVFENPGNVYNVDTNPGISLMGILGSPSFQWTDDGQAFYNQLDENSKYIYDQILDSVLGQEYVSSIEINSKIKITQDNIHNLIYPAVAALTYDKPQLSWLVGGYKSTGSGYKCTLQFNAISKKSGSGTVDFGGLSKIETRIANIKSQIDATLDENPSRYQIVQEIHDYICETIAYDYDNTQDQFNQTMYSAFYTDTGSTTGLSTVCAGYAKGVKGLCDAYNIPCILVAGTGNGGPHMWNYIQMENNKWYAVDCTWDDSQGGVVYQDYFLCGGNSMATHGAVGTFNSTHIPSGDPDAMFAYPPLESGKYVPDAFSSIELEIPTPAVGIEPQTTIDGAGYTGTITWSGNPTEFEAGQVYTATIELQKESPYSFAQGMTATVNGKTASVSGNTGSTATVTYTFPAAAASVPAPKVDFQGNTSISVSNSGKTIPASLKISGVEGSYNDITWELSEVSDESGILTLPETTSGVLSNGTISLGDFVVDKNAVDEPAKTATVKFSFQGNEKGHYEAIPEDIIITIDLAAGEKRVDKLGIKAGTWKNPNLSYGDSRVSDVYYTITNEGNVPATNIQVSLESGQSFRLGMYSKTLDPKKSTRVLITFIKGQDAGTYTDKLIVTSDECPEGATIDVSYTVQQKFLYLKGYTWLSKEYTGELLCPGVTGVGGLIASDEGKVNCTVEIIGGAVDVGKNYPIQVHVTCDSPNYEPFTTTYQFDIIPASRTIEPPTASSVSSTSITLSPAVVSAGGEDGTVEYGYTSENNMESVSNWQTSTTFTGLSPQTGYYFFARITNAKNYKDAQSAGALLSTNDKEAHTMDDFAQPSLSLTYGDTKIGQTTSCSTGGTITYQSSDPDAVSVNPNTGALTIHKVTNIPVTITATAAATDSYAEATRTYTVNVAPKELSITGLTAVEREYVPNKTTVELTGGELTGVIGNEDVTVKIPSSGMMADDNAGQGKQVAVTSPTLEGADAGNYTLAPISDITVNILKADPVVTVPTGPFTAVYGQKLSDIPLIGGTGDGAWKWSNSIEEVGDVGEQTHEITFTPKDTKNYNMVTKDITVTVGKASWVNKDCEKSVSYRDAMPQITSLQDYLPSDCGNVTFGSPTIQDSSGIIDRDSVSTNDTDLIFALNPNLTQDDIGKEISFTVPVTTDRYQDFSITVRVVLEKGQALFYDVAFDPNGGNGTMGEITIEEGSSYILPECDFTAPCGMRFVGWADGSPTGTQYTAGSTITIKQDTVLYALWENISSANTENSDSKTDTTKNSDGSITITVTRSDGTATQITKYPNGTKQVTELPTQDSSTATGTGEDNDGTEQDLLTETAMQATGTQHENKHLPQTGKRANAPILHWNCVITALAPEWKFRWRSLPPAS